MKIILDTLSEMSLTATVVILAVTAVRFLLRRCPKIYSYFLWAIVGIRLCVPVTFESVFSIFNLFERPEAVTQTIASDPVAQSVPRAEYDYKLLGCIWLAGMVILIIYGIYTYYRLQSKLRVSFPMGDSVYAVEGLASPFVMGFFDPKIYIPLGLDTVTEGYVLMHERTHLKRGDHIIKLFAFGLLCVHWFNPFCWLAFILMSRDMEMSCDERVLGTADISRNYSNALLSFAQNKHFPSPGPLCFGEVGVKRRIKNILSFKKPGFWITLLSCVICIAVFVSCSGGAVKEENTELLEDIPLQTEIKDPDSTANTSLTDTSEYTTESDTTIDTTADTTVDTTTADTTTADTTVPQTEAPVTTQYYETKEAVTRSYSGITPEMEASFAQSLKEQIKYMEESMRRDMERWYEQNTTAKSTVKNQYDKPIQWDIRLFP